MQDSLSQQYPKPKPSNSSLSVPTAKGPHRCFQGMTEAEGMVMLTYTAGVYIIHIHYKRSEQGLQVMPP